WLSEVRDGMAVDAARARFAAAAYRAAVAFADGGDATADLAEVDAALEAGRAVIAHRHAHLHAPDAAPLLTRHRNSTLYSFGYLYNADKLCYWNRERGQLRNRVLHETNPDPGCAL